MMAIGEVAAAVGVTTRTLRYYEEFGLVSPSGRSAGGSRRYSDDDVRRFRRIRELQALMGFNLEEIRAILSAEDRLDTLRAEYRSGTADERQQAIVEEAIDINNRVRTQVREKRERIDTFLAELDAKARRYRQVVRELGSTPARTR